MFVRFKVELVTLDTICGTGIALMMTVLMPLVKNVTRGLAVC